MRSSAHFSSSSSAPTLINDLLARLYPVDYRRYIGSAAWKRKAAKIRRRAEYRCERCGRFAPLDVHHKTYRRLGYEIPADLVALCKRCHGKVGNRH